MLGPEAADEVDTAAVRWTKEWGRRPLLDGRSFRDLYAWKGVSLWWFAELFLHHSTEATRLRARRSRSSHRLLDAEAPDEVEAHGLPEDEALLVERTCLARGILFHRGARCRRARTRRRGGRASARPLERDEGLGHRGQGRRSPAPPPAPGPGEPVALFLSHAAFWRERGGRRTATPRAPTSTTSTA